MDYYYLTVPFEKCYKEIEKTDAISVTMNSLLIYSYVSLAVGIMSFILAILGFVLAALKTRALAIIYCVLGLLTFILAVVVGSI